MRREQEYSPVQGAYVDKSAPPDPFIASLRAEVRAQMAVAVRRAGLLHRQADADARWTEAERHSETRRCSRWITEYLSRAFRDGSQLDASARARIAEGDRAFWKLHIEPYAGWANVR